MSGLPEVEEPIVVPQAVTTITLSTTPSSTQLRNKEVVNHVNGLYFTLKPTPPAKPREGSAKGKREAQGPIVTTSDEDEPPTPPSSPRESRDSVVSPPQESPLSPCSPTFHDHDYENVSSPGGSSTASGPTYSRKPGFSHHAHSFTISKPKTKKKKSNTAFIDLKDGISKHSETTLPSRSRSRREPMPMRMRALPQSFWQQPNAVHNVSPAQNYPLLPPLVIKDGEEGSDVRPISPTGEDRERHVKISKIPERKVTAANTDLLFKLFEGVEKEHKSKPSTISSSNSVSHNTMPIQPVIRRGRPRKIVPVSNRTLVSGEDPYLVDCVTESLFPQLTIEHSRALLNGTSMLQVVTIREGDKFVSLPSLSVEQNYSQMLSELVMHI